MINLHKSALQGRRSVSKREERRKNNRKWYNNQSTYVLLDHFILLNKLSENGNSEPHKHKSENLLFTLES